MPDIYTSKNTNRSIVDLIAGVNGQNRQILEVWTGTPSGNKLVYSTIEGFTIVNNGIVPKLIVINNNKDKYTTIQPGESICLTSDDINKDDTIKIYSNTYTGDLPLTLMSLDIRYRTTKTNKILDKTTIGKSYYEFRVPSNNVKIKITDTHYVFRISQTILGGEYTVVVENSESTKYYLTYSGSQMACTPVTNPILKIVKAGSDKVTDISSWTVASTYYDLVYQEMVSFITENVVKEGGNQFSVLKEIDYHRCFCWPDIYIQYNPGNGQGGSGGSSGNDSTEHTCTYDEYVDTVAPTCTEQGYDVYKCSDCGQVIHTNYTNPAHDYSSSTSLYSCNACGWIGNNPVKYFFNDLLMCPECSKTDKYNYVKPEGEGYICSRCSHITTKL